MKYKFNRKLSFSSFGAIALAICFSSCERDVSDDAVLATFPTTPDIFTDAPVGLTDAFFESFDPAAGANTNGFGVDNDVAYFGNSSIRIDVPAPNDADGGFIGGIFRDRGAGRNLTGYDALTFWVKGSTTATVGLFGFGTDFIDNKYATSLTNTQLSTDWKKIIIPIPDPSKLTQEKGMFIFSAGTQSTNGLGYTFWIDEIRFEKLGNISLLYPYILNGQDVDVDGFLGSTQVINQLGATFNLANGQNVSVNASPDYFSFFSSDTTITSPFEKNNAGDIFTTVEGVTGAATVTATMNNSPANGSLTINAVGNFSFAPTPTRPASNVISIFSNHYPNTPVDFFNGFWQPFQTTQSADFTINGDDILNYTNFNFVGIQFGNPTLNLTTKNNIHFNMFIPGTVPPNFDFLVTVKNFGADNVDGGGDDSFIQLFVNNSPSIVANQWMTIEFPLNNLVNRNNVGLIIFENINGSSLSNIYLDNIYFYNN